MRILVRAPATVANLGPGFDCFGLALDLWNEMEVSTTGNCLKISIEGEGKHVLPMDETNAIYRAMYFFAQRQGKTLPTGIQILCKNNIPLGSGLGSSSAATIAGILAAADLLEMPDDKEDQLNCATRMEGHSDNVVPCLLGGFTISLVDNDRVFSRKIPIHPFLLLIVTPDFNFPTNQARATLPELILHKDAVFNLSRVALLTDALRNGDFDLLPLATDDRLHQPYRIPRIPGAAAAVSAARNAGAVAVVMAGAGPSLLAFIRDQAEIPGVSASMVAAFQEAGLSARIYSPQISMVGASVQAI
jgi:homoserine kinase